MNHYLRRRIRPAGITLMIIGLILICLAGGQASQSLFHLLGFAFALGFLSLCWLPWRRARIEIARDLPPYATAGEPLTIRYQLKNLKARKVTHIQLLETPPDPRPTPQQFLTAHEPGEENRNRFDRLFSYYCWTWLYERNQRFEASPSTQLITIPRLGRQSVFAKIKPNRRGVIILPDLRLLLPDPLGFFQRCQRTPTSEGKLTVLPRRYRLPEIELPGSARFQPGGDTASRQIGASGEFVGLRDYHPGDPLRLIHWKSWARTGKPIIKEFEETFFPRHGLILDTSPDDPSLFEDAVSIAASFAASVDSRESLIDLMFISGQTQVISAGRGVGPATRLLASLAAVEATDDPAYEALKKLIMQHASDLAGCLAIFAGWSPDRQKMLRNLAAAEIQIAAIVVCHEPPTARPPQVHFVRHAELESDLMTLPTTL